MILHCDHHMRRQLSIERHVSMTARGQDSRAPMRDRWVCCMMMESCADKKGSWATLQMHASPALRHVLLHISWEGPSQNLKHQQSVLLNASWASWLCHESSSKSRSQASNSHSAWQAETHLQAACSNESGSEPDLDQGGPSGGQKAVAGSEEQGLSAWPGSELAWEQSPDTVLHNRMIQILWCHTKGILEHVTSSVSGLSCYRCLPNIPRKTNAAWSQAKFLSQWSYACELCKLDFWALRFLQARRDFGHESK